MQATLSPSAERLSAALKALRLTHEHLPGTRGKTALAAKCLKVILAYLVEEGVPQEDLQPLIDLEAEMKPRPIEELPVRAERDRRRGAGPSDTLLARACAVIDLLVKSGYDEGEAAQTVMRRLIASGVPAPVKGGDARGWKRLLEWRADLTYGFVSDEAKIEYAEFTRELEMIPPAERVKRVLDERLWDRRRTLRRV